jgi:phosphate:Na+ symporter
MTGVSVRLVLLGIVGFSMIGAQVAFAADLGAGKQPLELFTMVMGLLGGLAIFLFGMEQMAEALKSLAGARLKDLLARLTTNRFTGALTGAAVTAVIQSSSVTTVLTVGFITAGILSLSQAVGIIFGANIGTTITAQVIAFKVTKYALLLVALGFAMFFVGPRDRVKQYGAMIMGLGLIFFGMSLMSEAMKPLRSYEPFLALMGRMDNPFLGIGIAALFTGLVQSSSATTGVVIAMASQGLISLPAGIAMIFGANIGTCVTALLASIGKPREAVRAGLIHVLFNVMGVVLWVGLIGPLSRLVIDFSPQAAGLSGIEKLAAETPRQIANAHTVFNIANTLIFLPFAGLFARLVEYLVPDSAEGEEPEPEEALQWTSLHLDPALFAVPAVALGQARGEVRRMAFAVRHMLVDIMPAFTHNDVGQIKDIPERDRQVDMLEDRITDYLVQISRLNLPEEQSVETIHLLNVTKDLEHIGDLIEGNLMGLLNKKVEAGYSFSAEGSAELVEFHQRVLDSYDRAVQAFDQVDRTLAQSVVTTKAELVELEWTYRKTHYSRLSRALPETLETSQIHLELIDYLRRIDSYVESIARNVLESRH